ncbi:hypothetical protein NHX12_024928, partial [Muraenolepis orangiensis]
MRRYEETHSVGRDLVGSDPTRDGLGQGTIRVGSCGVNPLSQGRQAVVFRYRWALLG